MGGRSGFVSYGRARPVWHGVMLSAAKAGPLRVRVLRAGLTKSHSSSYRLTSVVGHLALVPQADGSLPRGLAMDEALRNRPVARKQQAIRTDDFRLLGEEHDGFW